MTKKINEVNGVKLIKRYSMGSLLSSFLCFLLATCVVLFFFFPFMGIKMGDTTYSQTGKTIIESLFNKPYELFDVAIKALTVDKDWVNTMYTVGLTVSAILYLIAIVFGVVMLFVGFEYLFRGRVNSYKTPKRIAWIMTLVCFFPLLAFAIAFKCIFKNESNPQTDLNIMWIIILFSVTFLCALSLNIVYVSCFKNRVFVGDVYELKHGNDNEQLIVDENGRVIARLPMDAMNASPSHEIVRPEKEKEKKTINGLPRHTNYIGGHAFSENLSLDVAIIPDTVNSLGVGAFANCLNLKMVSIPKSVKKISRNCFFNCARLTRVNYSGTKEQWRHVVRGSNWLTKAGTTQVHCLDGAILVDPYK